jgi:DNA-directed RNA polymerase subunit beta'
MSNSVWTHSFFIPDLTAEETPSSGCAICRCCENGEIKARKPGTVRFEHLRLACNEAGQSVSLTRQRGRIQILGPKGRPLESFPVRYGAVVLVSDGAQVQPNQRLCLWDPNINPILCEVTGKARLADLIQGITSGRVLDSWSGIERQVVLDHRGERHPHILIEDADGQPIAAYHLPVNAYLSVRDGRAVSPGVVLAKVPREIRGVGFSHWHSGSPDVLDLFEARPPCEPAKMATVSGIVRLGERRRCGRTIFIQTEEQGKRTGKEVEHIVPPGKYVRVANGDRVQRGDLLVFGPLIPNDILKISGPEAVQNYLVEEVQNLYRHQGIEIDDKHVEIIVAQMLRKVRVKDPGDTDLERGSVIDKFAFESANERLKGCVKIKDPGDSRFKAGQLVDLAAHEEELATLESPPTHEEPQPATAKVLLLGISALARQRQ